MSFLVPRRHFSTLGACVALSATLAIAARPERPRAGPWSPERRAPSIERLARPAPSTVEARPSTGPRSPSVSPVLLTVAPSPDRRLTMFQDRARRDLEPRLHDLEVRRVVGEFGFGPSWVDLPHDLDVSGDVGHAVRRATERVIVRSLKTSVRQSWSMRRAAAGHVPRDASSGPPSAPQSVSWRFGVSHGLPKVELRRMLDAGRVSVGLEAHGLLRASLQRPSGAAADLSFNLDEKRVLLSWRIPVP